MSQKPQKVVDRDGFTSVKAKPKPVEVKVPTRAKYQGIEWCKPHGINIDYCTTCKKAKEVQDAARVARLKKVKLPKPIPATKENIERVLLTNAEIDNEDEVINEDIRQSSSNGSGVL